ncbi:hypothetical protein MYX84_05150 [Acidobacteria bacterium AH-259-O06]|nr:hypothetical protein [Acidobacteria bacterium AH-259-O06]
MTIGGSIPSPRSYIHWNPDRTEYSLTEEELDKVHHGGQSIWKDFCLVSTSVGISTMLNAIATTMSQEDFSLTLSLFLNYLFGVVGVILAICFGIAWYKSHKSVGKVLVAIKNKPKMEIGASTLQVGPLTGETRKYK